MTNERSALQTVSALEMRENNRGRRVTSVNEQKPAGLTGQLVREDNGKIHKTTTTSCLYMGYLLYAMFGVWSETKISARVNSLLWREPPGAGLSVRQQVFSLLASCESAYRSVSNWKKYPSDESGTVVAGVDVERRRRSLPGTVPHKEELVWRSSLARTPSLKLSLLSVHTHHR
jgi:hypothetical protein